MYDVIQHKKNLEGAIAIVKEQIDKDDVEGLIIIRAKKNKDIELNAVFGNLTDFEWIGVMDYVVDVIKQQSAEAE